MTILLLYHNTLSQSINNISIIYMGLLSQMYPKTRCTMISIIKLTFRWKKSYTWPGLLVMLIYSYWCVIEFLFLPLLRKSFLVLLGIHASCRLGRCHSYSLWQNIQHKIFKSIHSNDLTINRSLIETYLINVYHNYSYLLISSNVLSMTSECSYSKEEKRS